LHAVAWRKIETLQTMKTITPTELNEERAKDPSAVLIDVRTPVEHAQAHVPGVHLMPLDRLEPATLEAAGCGKGSAVYILCQSGGRAAKAAAKLEAAGFGGCRVVEGGTAAWIAAGLPVERGASRVISLERQVRIAAGAIVFAGVLLAHFVNPAFIWLSGFVGAGLVFAGATDWCGMGMLIAKMPWNQLAGKATCSTR
jgi:rhodanese-related sulfurtransferase